MHSNYDKTRSNSLGTTGKIKLPLSSRGEDLETISRNKLSLLFDTRYFEARSELQRDKGIDFIVELKEDGAYTNFRFAVQLKSTESAKVNKDNSISYPIEVSNISYLLNYPMPAYYILYDHTDDHFYYEEVIQVLQTLNNKYKNGQYPDSFNFRFHKSLTREIIQVIYQKSLSNGNLLRSLTPHIDLSLRNPAGANGIVIDQDSVVSTIEENIKFILIHGFELLNTADFNTIIKIEQRANPRKEVSPIFNLICGAAYFYKGKSYKALDFLRLAQRKEAQLEPLLQSMLNYILLHAKHHVGILDNEELNLGTQSILEGEDIGSFLEIQKARKILDEGHPEGTKKLKNFCTSIQAIIEKEPDNPRTRGIAYVVLLDAESSFLINDLNKNLFFAVGSGKPHLKAKIYETWNQLECQYHKRLDKLMQFLMEAKDFQSSSNLARIKIAWHYQKAYMSHFLDNWNFMSLQSEGMVSDSVRKQLLRDCDFIDEVSKLFKNFEKDETIIHFLILKYQLFVFLEEHQSATPLKDAIYNLIKEHDFEILQKQFDRLTTGAFPHIHYQNDAGDRLKHIYILAQKKGIEKYLIDQDANDLDKTSHAEIKWTVDEFMPLDIPPIASSKNL
jgi:hypothetical protein